MKGRHHVLESRASDTSAPLQSTAKAFKVEKRLCEDQYRLFQPHINPQGVHALPFNPGLPVDVRFLACDSRNTVRVNRHDYFEVFFQCAGPVNFHVQDRFLPMKEGDLCVIGSALHHSAESRPNTQATIMALFFEPDLVRNDGNADSFLYLTPFLLQDSGFEHIVPWSSGVPGKVFDLIRSIHEELPLSSSSMRSRLAVKTYLKMILTLLINHYSSHASMYEAFCRQQRALDRLRPLLESLDKDIGATIQLPGAARFCGMSESHFMYFFKQVTGRSFMDYLKHRRVEHAQMLLATTDMPISDIAQETGFCAQSYFGSVFLKLVGLTPAAFRRFHHDSIGELGNSAFCAPRPR